MDICILKRKMTNTNTTEWGNIELPGLSDEKLLKTNWNRVAAGFENKHNEKLLALAKQKSQDITFSNTMKQVALQRDEEYLVALHNGIANRDNSYQAEVNSRPEVKAKISKKLKGKPKSESHRTSLKATTTNKLGDPDWEAAHKAGLAKRDKPFHAGKYGVFPNRSEAARVAKEQGLSNALKKFEAWTKTKPEEYYFITI